MKVAVVHSYYRSDVPSGENVAVDAQVEALRTVGHDVAVIAQRSDLRMVRRTYPLEAAWTTISGVGPDPTGELMAFGPDVVHIHNLFPNLGSLWLRGWRGPVVATVHNFRPMCAAGTLSRGGRRCTLCRDGSSFAAVRHACYHHSHAASVPLAWATRRGAAMNPVLRRANRLVAISARAVGEFETAGIPADRFSVVPNFVVEVPTPPRPPWDRWLFVGRLSQEKGLRQLLGVWPEDHPLDVIGEGDEADELRRLAGPGVRFLGGWSHEAVRSVLPRYRGLLVPSQWPEAGPPLTYLEALSAGTPVIACSGNGAADDITARGTGVVIPRTPTVHDLMSALERVAAKRSVLSARCRAVAREQYSASAWCTAIAAVYRSAGAVPTDDRGRQGEHP
jgi:glycosyltransferase involved in cell wall biosynthesis